MADVIDYKIYGDDLQLVEVELDPGEGVRAEVGTTTYMENDIEMQTGTGGGLLSGLKRAVTGESFFITTSLSTTDRRNAMQPLLPPTPARSWPLTWMPSAGRCFARKILSYVQPKAPKSKWPSPNVWAPVYLAVRDSSCSA